MKPTRCPKCKNEIELDATPEYNEEKPFERVCFACGWFDSVRYETEVDAELAVEDSNDHVQREQNKGVTTDEK